jgi:transcription antitermination factor NusG
LFKSYVFVCIAEADKTTVRMINGVVNFVYWLGKPAIIKDKEIEVIKRFLDEYDNVEVRQVNVKEGSEVLVEAGVFLGKKGIVKKLFNKKVEVFIESIGFALTAYIDKSKITLLEK